MAAQAGAAGGGGDGAARLDEGLNETLLHGLEDDFLGGGDDDAPHAVGHLPALEDGGGGSQVADAAVGAGADDHLVDRQAGHLRHHLGVLGQVGHGHGGLQLVQVDDHLPGVHRVGVGLEGLAGAVHPAADVLHGLFVHGEDAILAAGLDGHVGDGEPVVHGQRGNSLPGKLQGLVQSAVHPDLPDQVEDHVLAGHHGLELALQGHLNGGGHLEPQKAGSHGGGHISGADAGGEGPQRSVGAGVGVGAHDDLTRGAQPLLRQEGVLHPHLAHIEEIGDLVLVGEVPSLQAQLGGLDVLTGGIVVQNNGDLVLVEDLGKARLLKLSDGHRSGDVVAQHHVHLGLNELAHLHMVQSGVLGQDFLCHRHSHTSITSSKQNGSVFGSSMADRLSKECNL